MGRQVIPMELCDHCNGQEGIYMTNCSKCVIRLLSGEAPWRRQAVALGVSERLTDDQRAEVKAAFPRIKI